MHPTIHSKEHILNFDEHCLNELSPNSYVTQFNRRTSITSMKSTHSIKKYACVTAIVNNIRKQTIEYTRSCK